MRRIAAPLSVALLAGLTACGPVNRGMESVNQPVVSRSDFSIDVGVTPAGLAQGEDKRLAGWFDTMGLGYGDRIAIDDPASVGGAAARDTVAAVAARYGLLVGANAPVTGGAIPASSIRIVVSRSAARVDNCPNWGTLSQPNFAQSTSPNYGCAVNSNLAAMVANPDDLVRGQAGSGLVDASVASKAINTYRQAEPTGKLGLKQESTKQGGDK